MRRAISPATAVLLSLTLALTGCGGEDLDSLATEACDLYRDLTDPDASGADVDEAVLALQDLNQRAEESGYSDAQLEDALERNCPELADET